MVYTEKLTTVYYFDRPMDELLVGEALSDPEMEYLRVIEKEDFILNHRKRLNVAGILNDEQAKQEVRERGGFPPLEIARHKSVRTFLDGFENGVPLPHEVFR